MTSTIERGMFKRKWHDLEHKLRNELNRALWEMDHVYHT